MVRTSMGEVLPLAARIGEAQVDILDLLSP